MDAVSKATIRVQIIETRVYQKDYTPADLAHACGVKGSEDQIAEWVIDSFPAAVEVDVKSSDLVLTKAEWAAQVGGPWGDHAFAVSSSHRAVRDGVS